MRGSRWWAAVRQPSTFEHVAGHRTAAAGFKEGSDTLGGRHFELRPDTSRGRPALSDGRMTDAAPKDALRAAAFSVMARAYAPYSHFRVGAALATADGRMFTGCNVENAAYGATICAERAAVLCAVAQGERSFTSLVIATEGATPAAPCGLCRQVLSEFAPSLEITSCTTAGAESHWSLDQLLPSPFTSNSLPRS
jgi:cytidine deaminase